MESKTNWEMGSTLIRLRRLMMLQFLENADNIQSPFYQSVFIESVIQLDYLLTEWKNQKLKPEIDFRNDIDSFKTLEDGGYNDIKSLMRFFRNAICHTDSPNRKTRDESQNISFVFQNGNEKSAKSGLKNFCKYEDEIAALMGDHVLYIKRHLIKAYDEIYNAMLALPRFAGYKQSIQLLIESGR